MEEILLEFKEEYIDKLKSVNQGRNQKYYILTMGCKLNENDSEKLCGMLEQMNYQKTDDVDSADLILFNTCCVRENAEEKLFGKLGEVKKQKEQNGAIIAIGGCMMQEKHITDKIKKSYPFCDIIFGTHTLHKFPEDLYCAVKQNCKVFDILDIDGEIYEGLPIKRGETKSASITIMNGCNNFCTYCIVPYVRGRERSRDPKDILNEITVLAKEGYQEITLLGQNVNSYQGTGEEGIYKFSDLLNKLNDIKGIEIIRFLSPHPKDFTDDVIEAIKKGEKVCKLIHLPLQSGSSNVLKRMNRKYTKEQYLNLVEKMKQQIPDVIFTTDIIVGFPGETEEDFKDTLDVVEQVGFEQVFMFIYSRRKNTPADRMEDQILEEIKHERFDRLKSLVESQIDKSNQKYIGTIQKILVEGYSKNNPKMLTGRTASNKVVVFQAKEEFINKIVNVKITKNRVWHLEGEING